jgi:hypothetical protein
MMMMKRALLAAFVLSVADAATRVAVLEFGKGGTVRRTSSKNAATTVEGVTSFWSALHRNSRRSLLHTGMTVVPDLFQKPHSGVVIGLTGSGVDLDSMPVIAELVSERSNAVGHMELDGSHCHALLSNVGDWEEVEHEGIVEASVKQGKKNGITGLKTVVDSASAATVDQKISVALGEIENFAKETGQTIVVHVVVEEDHASARRRLLSRRLEDEAAGEEGGEEQGEQDEGAEEGEGDEAAENDQDDREYNGYYGYGYYNDYGEWITPFKTMFQIQYFNVVLWTSIGLVITVVFTIFLMVNMPLEPDTLLFGESAKLVGDE